MTTLKLMKMKLNSSRSSLAGKWLWQMTLALWLFGSLAGKWLEKIRISLLKCVGNLYRRMLSMHTFQWKITGLYLYLEIVFQYQNLLTTFHFHSICVEKVQANVSLKDLKHIQVVGLIEVLFWTCMLASVCWITTLLDVNVFCGP